MNGTQESTVRQSPGYNLDDIRRTFILMRRLPDQVTELRCPKTRWKTLSGYSASIDKLVAMAIKLNSTETVRAVYLTANPVNPALLARSKDRIAQYVENTTADADITRRFWFLIDIDPNPVSGISSTDVEHDLAQAKAKRIARWLIDHGIPEHSIILGDSGNGAHVLVAIDLPNDEESKNLLQRLIDVAAFYFAGHPKEIDRTVYNAARIWKVYGTKCRKGDDTPERPHRVSRLAHVPDRLEICPREPLIRIAALLPDEEPKTEHNGRRTYSPFDLRAFIERNEIAVKFEKPWNGWTLHILKECLFDPSHNGTEVYLGQHTGGALKYKCHHNSCVDKTWADVRGKYEPKYQKRDSKANDHTKGNPDDWPEPQKLPDELPPVPPMDPVMIPESLRPWLTDIAERMQCPLDFPVVGAIAAAASLIGRQLAIRPKKQDDWTVVPNLWGGAVGRPGIMKTPALDEAKKPLQRLEMDALEEHKNQKQAHEVKLMVLKAKKEEIQRKIKEAIQNGTSTDGFEIPKEEEFNQRRYILNDSTVEKLGELLNQNPNGLLLFRDELTGWLRTLDREGHENDRAFYLESWNGNGSYTYDRIGRGTLNVKAACVSILGGIQPGPLNDYLESTLKGGAGADGLFQRFQLLVYPDDPGPWKNIDQWPNTEAKDRAFEIFKKLTGEGFVGFVSTVEGVSRDEKGDGDLPFLRFSPEGQEVFDDWRAELESKIRADDEHPAIEAHLSKYRSLMPSLALIFHVVSTIAGENTKATPVSRAAAKMAAGWCDYLEEHARRIYHGLVQRDISTARRLAKKIETKELPNPFTARDVYRKCWTGLSDAEVIESAATMLDELGWIRTKRVMTGANGGRPTLEYHVNPQLVSKES